MRYDPFQLCLLVILCAAVNGCTSGRDASRPAAYFGPTDSIVDVTQSINANNSQLPTLWARGEFEATLVDDKDRTQFVNGSVTLLHRKPHEFRMVAKKDVAGQIFELGSTDNEYWMIVRPEADTMWWGTYDKLSQADPRLIPIQPDLLMEVLAIGEFDTDLTREPAPVMRFNNDADAYMFVWIVRGPGHWAAQREIWYDRTTRQPRLVLLFDINGRILLRAYLSDHKPVDGAAAKIATRYDLYFPDRGAKMKLSLTDTRLTNNGVPRDGSIQFPGDGAGVSTVIRVDEAKTR